MQTTRAFPASRIHFGGSMRESPIFPGSIGKHMQFFNLKLYFNLEMAPLILNYSMYFHLDIDAPKNLEASEITQSEATVTWTPPIAEIDGYILIYEDADGNRQVKDSWIINYKLI